MTCWPEQPRALMSYAYINDKDAPLPTGYDLLIDSGAFTAHTSGKSINLDEYTQWLADHRGQMTAALSLDVIGDPGRTLRQYEYQRAALPDAIELLPTWHITSDPRHLHDLCERASYVGIGGMVAHYRKRGSLMRAAIVAHKIAREHGSTLHGLGASGSTIRRLPWRSVDSSSWTMPNRQPLVYLARRNGTLVSIFRGENGGQAAVRNAEVLRRYGLNVNEYRTYGSSLASKVGRAEATRRTDAAVEAALRSYMYSETKGDTRIYYASSPPGLATIRAAWEEGSPW